MQQWTPFLVIGVCGCGGSGMGVSLCVKSENEKWGGVFVEEAERKSEVMGVYFVVWN